MLQRLSAPGLGLASAASFGVRKTLGRLLGKTVLSDMTEFFGQIGQVSNGLRNDASEVEAWLKAPQTQFYWITTPEKASTNAAVTGIQTLQELGFKPTSIILNRTSILPQTPFPKLVQPDGMEPNEWENIEYRLEAAWNDNKRRATLHSTRREELEQQVNIETVKLPSVAHSDNPADIVLSMAQHLNSAVEQGY